MERSARNQSAPQTSAAAIASLVLGILSCTLLGFLAGIPAIVCGHVARRKIRLSPHSYSGRGLAVAGLVLGYVGTVIPTLVLTVLVFAAVYNVRVSGYQARLSHTQVDLLIISTQLNLYQSRSGTYPTTEQGLRALVERPTTGPMPDGWYQLFREVPKDPWGHNYFYRSPAGTTYDLFSAGPDGVPNTADDIRKF